MEYGERMARLEEKVDGLNEKVDSGFSGMNKKLDDFIERSDRKFANKWVEDWLTWAGRIIIGAIIIAVLSLVIVNSK